MNTFVKSNIIKSVLIVMVLMGTLTSCQKGDNDGGIYSGVTIKSYDELLIFSSVIFRTKLSEPSKGKEKMLSNTCENKVDGGNDNTNECENQWKE